jgi:pyridoxal 4-dehydrogenase
VTRVALITGAAGDIGAAIARRLAADGVALVLTDLQAPDALAAELGARAVAVDLADAEAVGALGVQADILVNNAADLSSGSLAAVDLEVWRRVQAVNVEAPLLLARALVPRMLANGWGRIVNVISDTVMRPPAAGMLAYITSKGALLGLTRALAVELGGGGVTVNAVAPGLTPTSASLRDLPEAAFAGVRALQAIPRALRPEDVAGSVAYLVSDDASSMTGQTLCPDAGLVML